MNRTPTPPNPIPVVHKTLFSDFDGNQYETEIAAVHANLKHVIIETLDSCLSPGRLVYLKRWLEYYLFIVGNESSKSVHTRLDAPDSIPDDLS